MNTTNTTTRSYKVLETYGVPISSALYIMHNIWGVRPGDRDIFKQFYLLKWPVERLLERISSGTIERRGTKYQVIFHRTNYAELAKYEGDIFLSFRELQDEYELYPTVLVAKLHSGVTAHSDKETNHG